MDSAFTNDFSQETWYQKYKLGTDNSIEDTCQRVAQDLASIEKDTENGQRNSFQS